MNIMFVYRVLNITAKGISDVVEEKFSHPSVVFMKIFSKRAHMIQVLRMCILVS